MCAMTHSACALRHRPVPRSQLLDGLASLTQGDVGSAAAVSSSLVDDDADAMEVAAETSSYSAGFAQLGFAREQRVDPFREVTDVGAVLAKALSTFSSKSPGKVRRNRAVACCHAWQTPHPRPPPPASGRAGGARESKAAADCGADEPPWRPNRVGMPSRAPRIRCGEEFKGPAPTPGSLSPRSVSSAQAGTMSTSARLLALLVAASALAACVAGAGPIKYPFYRQCDKRWGNDTMGTQGQGEQASICREGGYPPPHGRLGPLTARPPDHRLRAYEPEHGFRLPGRRHLRGRCGSRKPQLLLPGSIRPPPAVPRPHPQPPRRTATWMLLLRRWRLQQS